MTENRNWLDNVRRIHFIGIGGSGMSPLAEILHAKGYALSGSDNNESDNLTRIRGLGIPVVMGHAPRISGTRTWWCTPPPYRRTIRS